MHVRNTAPATEWHRTERAKRHARDPVKLAASKRVVVTAIAVEKTLTLDDLIREVVDSFPTASAELRADLAALLQAGE